MNTPPFDNAVPPMEPKPIKSSIPPVGMIVSQMRARSAATNARDYELARARWWAAGWIAACDRDTEPDGSVFLSSKMAKCEFRMLKSAKRLLAATYPNP